MIPLIAFLFLLGLVLSLGLGWFVACCLLPCDMRKFFAVWLLFVFVGLSVTFGIVVAASMWSAPPDFGRLVNIVSF